MNLLLLTPDKLINDATAIIDEEQFIHCRDILKTQVGDTLKVGVINGKKGTAYVENIEENRILVTLNCNEAPTPPLPVTLIVGLSRPQTVKKVLSNATVMGVKELYFIHTNRVQKSYWHSPVLSDESLFRHLHEALQQTVDTSMPRVHFRKQFKPFIEDELPHIMVEKESYIFHPGDTCSKYTVQPKKDYLFMIGPEGGFIDYEIDLIKEQGVKQVSLGSRIMRVEQAVNAILGHTSISLAFS